MVSHNIFFASTNVFMSEKTDINRLRHGTGRNLAQRTAQNGAVAAAGWHFGATPLRGIQGSNELKHVCAARQEGYIRWLLCNEAGLGGAFWSIIEVDDFSLRVIHSLVHDLAAPLAPHEVVEVASSKNPLKVLCPSASQIVID